MNDLEICKRIAEIEGLIISNHSVDIDDLWVHICNSKDSSVTFFNPLTDDALCFQLMSKYKVWRWSNPYCGQFNVCIRGVQGWITSVTFNKAICLAIIEAHK